MPTTTATNLSDSMTGARESSPGNPILTVDASERSHSPLCVVGLSHHSAPIELRSKAALTADQTRQLLRLSKERLRECVVLSTCNRTEVYFSGNGPKAVVELLAEYCAFESSEIEPHVYVRHCSQAASHLFRVSSGLDSAVLGETEIVAQIKSAWHLAEDAGTTGPLVDLLLRRSLEAGKRVRSETDLCRNVTSTGTLAVKSIADRLGDLEEVPIALVGAGKIARRIARELQACGARNVTIVSRTLERAVELAAETGATATTLCDLGSVIREAEAVVAAANAAEPVIDAAALAELMDARQGRPLLIVDMGVPRNIAAHPVNGATVIDIDQLTKTCESNTERRMATVPAATAILEEELVRFNEALTVQAAAPTIRALMERAEAIRLRNFDWARERLPRLSESELRIVEDMARRMMKGMLQTPIQRLKGDLTEEHREVVARVLGLAEDDGDAA